MKREILFRGKRIDNGEWVEGFYGTGINKVDPDVYKHVIMQWTIGNTLNYFTDIDVIPESVGQFTGLTDKNGVKIFEGDVLKKWEIDYKKWEKQDYEGEQPLMTTRKDIATMDRFPRFWMVNECFGSTGEDLEITGEWEVIGNIHDNPELLNQ